MQPLWATTPIARSVPPGMFRTMPSIAVTVVGHDRPGIVNRVTAAIAELSGNLEDSSMSLLRGHFAMTLIADLPDTAAITALDEALLDLRVEGLSVSVFAVAEQEQAPPGLTARLSVHGADRSGIVRAATDEVLAFGGNITDLSTRLGRELYVLSAEVTFPPDTDLGAAATVLTERMADLGVHATLTATDEDQL